jgi:U6 snRNA-associated Sm-like protein LSm3
VALAQFQSFYANFQILSDVEETVTVLETDEESFEEIYKTTKRQIPMLFVRGDGVILVSPPTKYIP